MNFLTYITNIKISSSNSSNRSSSLCLKPLYLQFKRPQLPRESRKFQVQIHLVLSEIVQRKES